MFSTFNNVEIKKQHCLTWNYLLLTVKKCRWILQGGSILDRMWPSWPHGLGHRPVPSYEPIGEKRKQGGDILLIIYSDPGTEVSISQLGVMIRAQG